MASAIKNSMYYGLGSIIRALTSFFLLPIYANTLGTSQYGTLNLLQTFSTILAPIMTLSIEKSIYRLYFDCKNDIDKKIFLSTVFWTIIITGVIVLISCIFLSHLIVPYLGNVDAFSVLMPVVVYTFLSALITFCQILLQTQQRGAFYFIISILVLFFYNSLALYLLFYWSPTYRSEVYACLISYLLVLPIAFCTIHRHIGFFFDRNILGKVVSFTFPLFIMSMFSWILSASDRVFIANYQDTSAVGLYSMAFKLVSMGVIVVGSIKQAFDPYFFNIVNTLDKTIATKRVKPVIDSMVLITSILFFGILVFGKWFVIFFLNEEFTACLPYLFFLVISSLFAQQSTVLNVMILQQKKTKVLSMITICSGIGSLILNYSLIPLFGALMAAVNSMLIGLVMFLVTWYEAKNTYYIPINFNNIVLIVLLMAISFVSDMYIYNIFAEILIKLVLLIACPILLYKTNIVTCPSFGIIIHRLVNKTKMT